MKRETFPWFVSRFTLLAVKKRLQFILSLTDPGYLVVLGICLLAVWSFLSRPALPQYTDAELHIFRLAELSRLFRDGEFFSRWAPHFYFGYGYPIYNYYAPLTYYIGLLFDFLPVIGPVSAVKAVFVLGILGAGTGMYGYVRRAWGRAAGVIAATAYIYAPYILFIDPHARGDMAEAFSFALFPFALWAFDCLRTRPNRWNWFSSIFIVAAIILSHNLMAMVLFGLLLAWVIWHIVTNKEDDLWVESIGLPRILARFRTLLALALAIGISAFFWLVVGLEQNAVNLSSLVGQGGHFDFRNHFLNLAELFGPVEMIDWGATEANYRLNLGIFQWALGLIGIVVIALNKVSERRSASFFAVASVFIGVLMLPISEFIWDLVPLMDFLQFPWRLLGAEAAMLAILAGVATSYIVKNLDALKAGWITALIMGALIMTSLPLLEVPPWPKDFGPTTAARVLSEELAGRWLGTTSTADFVPKRVDIIPKAQPGMVEDILNGRPIDRVNRASIPDGTSVNSIEKSLLDIQFEIDGDQDFLLRLFLFDFPGWKATIDGAPVEIEVGRPEGFVVIPVPAGIHQVEVKFGLTPARVAALVVTLVSLGLSLLTGRYFPVRSDHPEAKIESREPKGLLSWWPIFSVIVVIFLVSVLIIQPGGWLRQESRGNAVLPADHATAANFGQQVRLLGYNVPNSPVDPGDTIEMTIFWKAIGDIDINYQVFVHLLDSQNNLVAQSDKLNPGEFPTKMWPDDKYVLDEHKLELPEEMTPGEYMWSVGLWVASEGWRLPLLDEQGNQVGDSFILPDRLVVE